MQAKNKKLSFEVSELFWPPFSMNKSRLSQQYKYFFIVIPLFPPETSIYYPRAGAGISVSQFRWDPLHG